MSKGEIDRRNRKIKSGKQVKYVGYRLRENILADNRKPRPVQLGCRVRVINAFKQGGLIGAYEELNRWNTENPKASFTIDDCNRWIEEENKKSGKSKEAKNDGR